MKVKAIFSCVMLLVPLAMTLVLLPAIPEIIPAHWHFDGSVTRYGSRYELLIAPFVAIFVGGILMLYLKQHQSDTVIYGTAIGIAVLFISLQAWFLHLAYTGAETLGDSESDVTRLIAIGVSISWVVIGAILPLSKQNMLLGIRVPWTLKSELSWQKTHNLGGKLMIACGLLSTLLCLFLFNAETAIMVSVLAPVLVLVPLLAYARHIYKLDTEKQA